MSNVMALPNRNARFFTSVDLPAPECPAKAIMNGDLSNLFSNDRLIPICQIDHNRVAGFDQVFWRDHDLFAPLSRTRAEDGFVEETRFQKGSKSGWLPVKGWDRTDHVTGRFFNDVWFSHPNIPRPDSFFQIPRDRVLIAAEHHEHTLARIYLEYQSLYSLALSEAQCMRDIRRAFFGGWWKTARFVWNISFFKVQVGRKLHGSPQNKSVFERIVGIDPHFIAPDDKRITLDLRNNR